MLFVDLLEAEEEWTQIFLVCHVVVIFTDVCYERDARVFQCGLGRVLIDPVSGMNKFLSFSLDEPKRHLLGELLKKRTNFDAESFWAVVAHMLWMRVLESRKSFWR